MAEIMQNYDYYIKDIQYSNYNMQEAALAPLPSTTHSQSWVESHIHASVAP